MTWKVHLEDLLRFGLIGKRMYVMRGQPTGDGRFEVVTSLTIKSKDANESVSQDESFLDDGKSFGLRNDDVRGFLQAMSDAAWEIGIKPKQLEDSRNELTAVRFHLEDMRHLAGVKK